jgi:hypothetical protein
MMTPRTLCWTALAIALAMHAGMIVAYGMMTDWCFCAISGYPDFPVPPPFVLRFTELVLLPEKWLTKALPVAGLLVLNLEVWFIALLALLHAMALAARVRFRPARGGTPSGRRIWLAGREAVRPMHMVVLAGALLGAMMAGGAMYRRAWLAQAEQVFAATIAAASADRPLPAGVQFWMWEWRGDDMVDVKPDARYVVRVDPRVSGDWFLDRFVVPYSYGGVVRFDSGRAYYFDVHGNGNGWSVDVDRSLPPEYW